MRSALAFALIFFPLSAQKALKKPEPKVEAAKSMKINWEGEWSLSAGQSDKLPEKIEEHLKDLNFAARAVWKKKLANACQSYDKLDVLEGNSFSLTMGKERSLDTPLDGTVNEWTRSDGEVFKASMKKGESNLTQTLQGESYTLTQVFSMRADGDTLALQITYKHPKLEQPFSYKLVYKRKG
jgi:hypothetical protein